MICPYDELRGLGVKELSIMSEELFTASYLENLWQSPDPVNILALGIINDSQLYEEPDNPECQLMAEIILHVICDAIEDVKLNFNQASAWVKAVYSVLKDNVRTREFSKELDFKKLSLALSPCKDLTRDHLTKLLESAKLTYFAHFNLYAQVFTSPREQVHINFSYIIDLPNTGLPLSSATMIEPPPPIQEDTAKSQTLEEFRNEMQDEYKYVGVDDATRNSIMEKLKKARAEMEAQLELRQKQMSEKISALEGGRKKK
mmetsp:Transcript_17946/g.32286  ORF Transcript_17946/g.32286 Transcript_17946/m.32286 type:complete len:259 (+) Transcript_17946:135-911(+)